MEFLKKNLISIVSMLIILIIFMLSFFSVKKEYDSMYSSQKNLYYSCLENKNDNCLEYIKEFEENDVKTADTITVFFTSLMEQKASIMNYLLVIFLVVPSLIPFCKICKNKIINNILNRKKYNEFLKETFINCYKKVWIIFIPLLILFIASLIYSGHFNYNYILNSESYYSFYVYINPLIYCILYFVSILFFTIFYINIGLIVARKNSNIAIVGIESFLLFIIIDIIFEIIFGFLISKIIFNSFSSRFNLLNILNIGYAKNILEMILIPLILVIISFVILKIIYKSKEKFIIDCNKNN